MAVYLEGIDRDVIHRAWQLREEARANGNRKATLTAILNELLTEALADDHWEDLRRRFCVKPSQEVQLPLFGG